MSIFGLITAVVLLLVTLAYIVLPLLQRETVDADVFRNKQRERALAYYERVLRNVRDLDDDLATDKISQEEYTLERERWMGRGVELLRMLDNLDEAHNLTEQLQVAANDADIDAAIEAAINTVPEQQTANEVI
ncbi:MAG: hypothetical protein WBC91_07150 [Phototrophicaceae bacterium]